jgi:hypothetical protein
LPHGPLPCKSDKTWAATVAPVLWAIASQILLCPAAALPTIVFPDFARSLSADGLVFFLMILLLIHLSFFA